jgi:CheY-like chemotaxis protein
MGARRMRMGNARPAIEDEPRNSASSSGPTTAGEGRRAAPRLLIVDDDPLLADSLSELLQEEGYEVETFNDARLALERLKSGPPPNALLLDYLMPLMSGEEFLDALEGAGVHVKVILFTALHESALAAPAGRVAALVRKPFDLDPLLETIARIAGK